MKGPKVAAAVAVASLSMLFVSGCGVLPELVQGSDLPPPDESGSPSAPAPETSGPPASELPTPAAPEAEVPTPVPPEAEVPTPAAPQVRPGSASCLFEDVAGETANASLAEVSRGAFDAVDCRSTESLEGQLLAIQNSPEFTSRVAQEGWMVQTGTTADSVGLETIELSITDMSDSGSFEICAVVVSDSPRSKSLFCSDEGADPPQV